MDHGLGWTVDWGGPWTEVDRGLGKGGGGWRGLGWTVDWGGPWTVVDRGLTWTVDCGGSWAGVDRGLEWIADWGGPLTVSSSSGTGRADRKWMFL